MEGEEEVAGVVVPEALEVPVPVDVPVEVVLDVLLCAAEVRGAAAVPVGTVNAGAPLVSPVGAPPPQAERPAARQAAASGARITRRVRRARITSAGPSPAFTG
ncbi:MAG TPA: hypothetical protein VFN65_07420, partial [Solirubrobacteraceae bacterium]|nr:hypothetical protein [Solirubrobacteraceae bacterium]